MYIPKASIVANNLFTVIIIAIFFYLIISKMKGERVGEMMEKIKGMLGGNKDGK